MKKIEKFGKIKTVDIVDPTKFILEIIETKKTKEEYEKIYEDFWKKAQEVRGCIVKWNKRYNIYLDTAIHHIRPKVLGGKEVPENGVIFTRTEHFIAHLLLHLIYPENEGLAKAVILIAGDREEVKDIVDYLISLDGNFDILFKRIKNISKTKIPVICLDEEYNVLKEFDSFVEAGQYFNISSGPIYKACKRGTRAGGNRWMKKEEFIEKYEDKYLVYEENLQEGIVPNIEINIKRQYSEIYCCSFTGDVIYKKYNGIREIELDGFNRSAIQDALSGTSECKSVREGITWGYRWIYVDKWKKEERLVFTYIFPFKIKGYIELDSNNNIISWIREDKNKLLYNNINRWRKKNNSVFEHKGRFYCKLKSYLSESLENELTWHQFLKELNEKEEGGMENE